LALGSDTVVVTHNREAAKARSAKDQILYSRGFVIAIENRLGSGLAEILSVFAAPRGFAALQPRDCEQQSA
jgi:hypothetical protein